MNFEPKKLLVVSTVGLGLTFAACSGGAETTLTSTSAVESLDGEATATPLPTAQTETADTPTAAPSPDSAPEEAAAVEQEPAEATNDAPDEVEPDPEPAGPNELPDVTVLDVATGAEVNLASFAPADKPIVLWFWAPH